MPNTKSALKRIKTDAVKTLRNKAHRSKIATYQKRLFSALEQKDFNKANEELKICFSSLDKAAKKGVIKKRKANRKKSALSKKLLALKK